MLCCEEIFCGNLFQDMSARDLIPILAIGGGVLIGLVGLIGSLISGVAKTRARERTRREIAAYVAEGSMTPEDAQRIMDAGRPHWECRSPNRM